MRGRREDCHRHQTGTTGGSLSFLANMLFIGWPLTTSRVLAGHVQLSASRLQASSHKASSTHSSAFNAGLTCLGAKCPEESMHWWECEEFVDHHRPCLACHAILGQNRDWRRKNGKKKEALRMKERMRQEEAMDGPIMFLLPRPKQLLTKAR